jgi:hypothetical protein
MSDHVAVRMPREAAHAWEFDAAEHERRIVREGVRVETDPNT